jgi:large-conductance mechanosensitive channel
MATQQVPQIANSVLDFIVKERILSLTVLCSIATFQFINSFKAGLVDPILEFILPEYVFDYLNITVREGYEQPKIDQKKLVIDLGQLLKGFFTWIVMIGIFYILYKYTRLQVSPGGNPGVAIM